MPPFYSPDTPLGPRDYHQYCPAEHQALANRLYLQPPRTRPEGYHLQGTPNNALILHETAWKLQPPTIDELHQVCDFAAYIPPEYRYITLQEIIDLARIETHVRIEEDISLGEEWEAHQHEMQRTWRLLFGVNR